MKALDLKPSRKLEDDIKNLVWDQLDIIETENTIRGAL